MEIQTRIFLYLSVLSLLPMGQALAQQKDIHDMEIKPEIQVQVRDIAHFESDILTAQKKGLQYLPQTMQTKNILGWRFLDRNSQSVGKIVDVLLDIRTGDFRKIKVAPDRLNFVGPLYFDMKAQNIEIEDSVIRCDMDKRQIQDSQLDLGKAPEDMTEMVSLKSLSGSLVYDRDGVLAATVRGAFGMEKDHKITYLDTVLAQTRQGIAIPLNQIKIVQQNGLLGIHLTDEQLAVMKRLAK
ncbi:MAG: PRC-barrel domain-containing protein [Pseudobdellovibrionaceae bacterium]|jgi:sporulation protein YlmC with PRC-barrel domain|nr:PRC-barrel domain-containing protein [Pseudobdellovibrionaceae bacterium]